MNEIDRQTKTLFDYGHLGQEIKKADAIIVLGSRDLRSANFACDLFFQGYAPLIIFSGDSGDQKVFEKTEAETFCDIALERGVPPNKILIENKSKNSWHNIEFTRKLVAEKNLKLKFVIILQKPHTERRVFATMKKQWPDVEFVNTSYPISFKDYVYKNPDYSREEVISRIVGDFQRIVEYPKRGFQIEQEVTPKALKAFDFLVKAGFDKKLIKKP